MVAQAGYVRWWFMSRVFVSVWLLFRVSKGPQPAADRAKWAFKCCHMCITEAPRRVIDVHPNQLLMAHRHKLCGA